MFHFLLKAIYLCVFLSNVTAGTFDPEKCDYCSIGCKDGGKHPACGCLKAEPKPPCSEVVSEIVKFREGILKFHNAIRQRIAAGIETVFHNFLQIKLAAAADMKLLNYDLELEFLARCYGRLNKHHHITDCAATTSKGLKLYDNIGVYPFENPKTFQILSEWYYKGINRIFDNNSFVGMIHSKSDRVGCARILEPLIIHQRNLEVSFSTSATVFVVLCLYTGDVSARSGPQEWVDYKTGKSCSRCPGSMKCESKTYKSLCGKEEPIPDSVIELPGKPNNSIKLDNVEEYMKFERYREMNLTTTPASAENTTTDDEKSSSTKECFHWPLVICTSIFSILMYILNNIV